MNMSKEKKIAILAPYKEKRINNKNYNLLNVSYMPGNVLNFFHK